MALLTHNDYTIAWICSLPLERATAEVMLDKIHQTLPKPTTDPNAYILGNLHGHHVVIACLPMGIYGTVSAATVISHLISTFPRVQYALMVGIGGGAPNSSNNIRLGDVVVSKSVGKYSGVIQYDYGKTVQGGQFERTGMLNSPPQVLLTHMAHLQANQMTRGENAISTIVRDKLEQNSNMKNGFAPPSQDTDYLFRSSYHHFNKENDCAKCDKQQLVYRQPRENRTPHIHYGLIASGDQVMKDSETRDRLAQQLGIICFEMEAAGLMNQLPTLVIRGICDYSDSHKQKEWQGYAALTAAAYAKVLLSAVPAPLKTGSDARGVALQNDHSCLQALQSVNPFAVKNRLKENKDKLLVDAIQWIFHDSHYCRWQDDGNVRLLWIRGGAGKGKTMMSIGLIEKLSQNDDSIITYFFCQNADYKLNTIEAILKGLIWQLIQQRPELIKPLQRHWDAGHSRWKENMSWRTLWDILSEVLHQCLHQRVYVVVDALDECQNSGMAEFLKLMVRTGLDHHHVKWLLTSRPLDSADRELLTTAEQVGIGLELNSDHLEAAIKVYVDHKVDELYPSHHYGLQMPQRVASELLKRAEGTFLWVSLVCKRLESGWSGERVPPVRALSTIQDLPPGLHLFYERAFSQIIEGHSALVNGCLRLLKVMMLVYRPLEMTEIVSVTGLSESEVASKKIVDRCVSFLKMRGSIVEFVHQSSRDFLAGSSPLSSYEQYGHGKIALNCLSYMSTKLKVNLINLPLPNSARKMAAGGEGGSQTEEAVLNSMNYAATFWTEHLEVVTHTRLAQSALDTQGQVMAFLHVNLLEWLECLSLLGHLPHAIKALNTLESVTENSLLRNTIFDAKRFLLRHYHTISTWPIQIYSSTICFSPQASLVRAEHNTKKAPEWLKRIPHAEKIWEPLIQTLQGHSDSVRAVAFSPDGQHIASASSDKTIRLWDASTGDHLKTLQGHFDWVNAIAFSPDGQLIASASSDETVRLWDACTGDHLKTLQGHSHWIRAIAFSLDGQYIASASDDKSVRLWDAYTGDHLKTLKGHSDWVRAIAFSPDSKHIASASSDKTVQLWDISTGDHLKTLQGHSHWIRAIAFSPDGQYIASASDDKTIRLWDARMGDYVKTLQGHSDWVRAIAFSPDGQHIASASSDETVRLWDASTGNHLKTLQGHSHWIRAIAFSPDGQYIASASDDKSVRLWDTCMSDYVKSLQDHSDWVNTVVFSPDGQLIASASDDKTIRLWDTCTGDHLKTLQGHSHSVNAIAFSPDGKHIASASSDETVQLWDAYTGNHLKTLKGHFHWVNAVAFSPDGQHIASASSDETVRLWDASTGNHLKILQGHSDWVRAIAFSPDGQYIASASDDMTVKLWNVSASLQSVKLLGNSLGAFRKFRKWHHQIQIPTSVTSLKFSSNGQFLHTNRGLIKPRETENSGSKGDLYLENGWICYRSIPIFRILPGLLPSCYDVRGDYITIGFTNGQVLCLEFDCRILDQIFELHYNRSDI